MNLAGINKGLQRPLYPPNRAKAKTFMFDTARIAKGQPAAQSPFRRASGSLVSDDLGRMRPAVSGADGVASKSASTGSQRGNVTKSKEHGLTTDLAALQERLAELSQACAEAITVCVQQYQGEPTWVIGAMPGCGQIADDVESQARALLAHSLSGAQIEEVAQAMRSSGDLRATARAARQASQLIWLFRQDAEGDYAIEMVRAVGEATVAVAQLTARALHRQDINHARNAALLYRDVDAARASAERALNSQTARAALSPLLRRMSRAAIWYMAVAGEGMARAAVRSLRPDATAL